MDSFFSHQAFVKDLDVRFPVLSDFNREVVPQYAGFYPDGTLGLLNKAGRRAVFVLDRSGTVRWKWLGPESDPGVLPNPDQVLEAVRAID